MVRSVCQHELVLFFDLLLGWVCKGQLSLVPFLSWVWWFLPQESKLWKIGEKKHRLLFIQSRINQAADISRSSYWAWTNGWCENRHNLMCSLWCCSMKVSRALCSSVLFPLCLFPPLAFWQWESKCFNPSVEEIPPVVPSLVLPCWKIYLWLGGVKSYLI